MKKRGTRLVIILCTLALQAAATYKLVETDRRLEEARLHRSGVSEQTEHVARLLAELRAYEFAHVAGAQTATAEPSGNLFDEIERRIGAMRALVGPDAAQALGVSLDHLRSLRETDSRVRTAVAAGDRVTALDTALGDAREITSNLAGQVGQARESESKVTEARIGMLRLIEAYFLIGALGAGLLALLVLFPGARLAAPAPVPAETRIPAPAEDEPAGTLGLQHVVTPRPAATPASSPRTDEAAVRAAAATDLWNTARLCTDVARIANPTELPAALERVAALLEASGVIVWVVDPGDRSLRPAAAHGYSSEALNRIGAIQPDADNATAEAARSGELQVVRADGASPGALAAPMAGPSGCVGVMAAELRPGRESDPAAQAVATILAAQLATLVQPTATTPA